MFTEDRAYKYTVYHQVYAEWLSLQPPTPTHAKNSSNLCKSHDPPWLRQWKLHRVLDAFFAQIIHYLQHLLDSENYRIGPSVYIAAQSEHTLSFYRTMHFSAERGFAIACRLSVRLWRWWFVIHVGWKSWKLIAQTSSPTPSFFAAKRRSTYSQGNMGKFWGD